MRIIAFILFALAASLLSVQDAQASKRVALIIGISSYKHAPRLANPARDAEAMAGLFRTAGFEVVEVRRDLGIAEMRRAVRNFSVQARDADMAVVYYAGHGIEVDGVNYLLPADAKLESDFDVEDEAISLDRILKSLEQSKRLRLVILDACRDNPFANSMKRTVASRSIGRGLAKVEPMVSGTLIAFAARAGAVASDGDGGNSPFTAALVKHIASPGLDLRLAFGKVRDDVIKATNNRQEPFVYGSLGGDTVSLVPQLAAPAPDAKAEARREYEFAAQIGTKQAWDSFLKNNKSGLYADLARANLEKLATAEQASVKADDARRQAELQEKAKAAEFRKQLEEHGARQAEEARRKVSEEARQRLEEVRRQGAEQAKRELDEARRQLEQARKQAEAAQAEIEVAKRHAVEDARRQLEEAKKDAESSAKLKAREQVAALAPADSKPAAATPAMDPSDIARLLQAHLKRVGCDPGTLEGNWNEGSTRSLQQFNQSAGTSFNVKIASLDALDAVRAKTSRVCPLVCAKGQRADNEKCVQITCESGFSLSPQGVCKKLPPAPKVVSRQPQGAAAAKAAPAARGGGGKCFSFNGRQYCE